jgi:hypothetical protein
VVAGHNHGTTVSDHSEPVSRAETAADVVAAAGNGPGAVAVAAVAAVQEVPLV